MREKPEKERPFRLTLISSLINSIKIVLDQIILLIRLDAFTTTIRLRHWPTYEIKRNVHLMLKLISIYLI